MDLSLDGDSLLDVHSKAFGAVVHGSSLTLPKNLVAVLKRFGVRSAVDFMGFLHASPSGLAASLAWPVDQVVEAREDLVTLLTGVLDDKYLHPSPPPQFAYGAKI